MLPARNFLSEQPRKIRLLALQKQLTLGLQKITKLQRQIKKMTKASMTVSDQRKAENRTKIQLGGLVIKSGLADYFNIVTGEDLQLDPHALDKATVLLGALIDAVERVQEDPSLQNTWSFLGEKSMRQEFIIDKNLK